MAKVSGITTTVNLDDSGGVARAITNDVTSIDCETPRGSVDITGLDKSAIERLQLRADFKGTLNGVFNTAGNMSHDCLKTVGTTSVARTLAIGFPGATLTAEVIIESYQVKLGDDGSLTWSAPFSLANGTAAAWS